MQNSEFSEAGKSTSTSLVEFDVNLSCFGCASAVKKALSDLPGVKQIHVDVEKKSVLVESSLPSQTIKEALEKTGKRAVLKGFGSKKLESAVAELKGQENVIGVIRFHQTNDNLCVIDGTIDGLLPGDHGLHIHEFGDLSQNCESIGSYYNPVTEDDLTSKSGRIYGNLGSITADAEGRASFRFQDPVVRVSDVIGRSIAVSCREDDGGRRRSDGNSEKCLAAAIIARSAGLFDNPKRLCQCDGTTVWDEAKLPGSSL